MLDIKDIYAGYLKKLNEKIVSTDMKIKRVGFTHRQVGCVCVRYTTIV
jgi:hypothetical protein